MFGTQRNEIPRRGASRVEIGVLGYLAAVLALVAFVGWLSGWNRSVWVFPALMVAGILLHVVWQMAFARFPGGLRRGLTLLGESIAVLGMLIIVALLQLIYWSERGTDYPTPAWAVFSLSAMCLAAAVYGVADIYKRFFRTGRSDEFERGSDGIP